MRSGFDLTMVSSWLVSHQTQEKNLWVGLVLLGRVWSDSDFCFLLNSKNPALGELDGVGARCSKLVWMNGANR